MGSVQHHRGLVCFRVPSIYWLPFLVRIPFDFVGILRGYLMSQTTIYTSMVLGPCIIYLRLDHKQTMNHHDNYVLPRQLSVRPKARISLLGTPPILTVPRWIRSIMGGTSTQPATTKTGSQTRAKRRVNRGQQFGRTIEQLGKPIFYEKGV